MKTSADYEAEIQRLKRELDLVRDRYIDTSATYFNLSNSIGFHSEQKLLLSNYLAKMLHLLEEHDDILEKDEEIKEWYDIGKQIDKDVDESIGRYLESSKATDKLAEELKKFNKK